MAHAGGRPREYQPEELYNKFVEYIDFATKNERFPNIQGFCVYAGIVKDTYYRYAKLEEFSDYIKRMDELLEDATIQYASSAKNPAFYIFYMKNKFDYVDKREIVSTNNRQIESLEDVEAKQQALYEELKKKFTIEAPHP